MVALPLEEPDPHATTQAEHKDTNETTASRRNSLLSPCLATRGANAPNREHSAGPGEEPHAAGEATWRRRSGREPVCVGAPYHAPTDGNPKLVLGEVER